MLDSAYCQLALGRMKQTLDKGRQLAFNITGLADGGLEWLMFCATLVLQPHLETPPGWLLRAHPACLVCAWLLRSALCADLPCPTAPGYTLSAQYSTRQTQITNNYAVDQGSRA